MNFVMPLLHRNTNNNNNNNTNNNNNNNNRSAFELCDGGPRSFSRYAISKVLGGGVQCTYPYPAGNPNGKYATIRADWNPDAPIAPGVDGIMLGGTQSSPIMEYDDWYASFEAHEGRGIPMFVRRGPNKWEFCGMYVVDMYEPAPFSALPEKSRHVWIKNLIARDKKIWDYEGLPQPYNKDQQFQVLHAIYMERYVVAMHMRCIGDYKELLDKIREASAALGDSAENEEDDNEKPHKSNKSKSKSTKSTSAPTKSTKSTTSTPSKASKPKEVPDAIIAMFPEEFM